MPQTPLSADQFLRRHFRPLLAALLLVSAALYLLGNNAIPLWDRDEPRYAQTSRQMLTSGDWVVPRFLTEVRTAKPVFIYWCQAISMSIFGSSPQTGAAAARLPSAIAMLATIAILALTLRRAIGPVRAFWAAAILATSLLPIALAKMCMTDAVLLLPVTIEQLCLYASYRRRATWPIVILFAASLAVAGLTKGPVAIAFPAMTLLALPLLRPRRTHATDLTRIASAHSHNLTTNKDLRRSDTRANSPECQILSTVRQPLEHPLLKSLAAILIIAAIVSPWLYLVTQRDPGFIGHSLAVNVWQRVTQPAEHHSGPPGYYLLTIWAGFFPWSLLLPLAIVTAWRHRRLPQIRFTLAAVVGPWIFFEIISTKLPHYLLPIYPALALLTADALVRGARHAARTFTAAFARVAIAWAILICLLGLTPWLAPRWFPLAPGQATASVVFSLLMIALGIGIARDFYNRRIFDAAARMAVGMLAVCFVAYLWLIPSLQFLQVSRRVAGALRDAGATAADPTVMIDYKEPSLAFYQGGTIAEIPDKTYLRDTPRNQWPRWIVISDHAWQLMPTSVRRALKPIAQINGWAYADGARLADVHVLENPAFSGP